MAGCSTQHTRAESRPYIDLRRDATVSGEDPDYGQDNKHLSY
jgi:hypothetical protein